jgi:hypothetical protein
VGIARVLLVLLALARTASAEVDWANGLVTANGVGVADRHAPNPAVARGTSRRTAEDAAKRAIAAQLPPLPLASGGTLADKLTPAIQSRIDRAIASALTVSAEPQTDGSWHVTLAVPIEAIRLAVTGPRPLPPTGDADPPIVIVDSPSKPALGSAPTLWVKQLPPWAKDAPHAKQPTPSTSTLFLILSP